jgi:hypothetical protein
MPFVPSSAHCCPAKRRRQAVALWKPHAVSPAVHHSPLLHIVTATTPCLAAVCQYAYGRKADCWKTGNPLLSCC